MWDVGRQSSGSISRSSCDFPHQNRVALTIRLRRISPSPPSFMETTKVHVHWMDVWTGDASCPTLTLLFDVCIPRYKRQLVMPTKTFFRQHWVSRLRITEKSCPHRICIGIPELGTPTIRQPKSSIKHSISSFYKVSYHMTSLLFSG